MTPLHVLLVDRSSARIAELDVTEVGDSYRGLIDLDSTPPLIRQLFERFEELVESQVFNVADEVEDKIAELALKAVFPNGKEAFVDDLQVYPSTRRVSFKAGHRSLTPASLSGLGIRDLADPGQVPDNA